MNNSESHNDMFLKFSNYKRTTNNVN